MNETTSIHLLGTFEMFESTSFIHIYAANSKCGENNEGTTNLCHRKRSLLHVTYRFNNEKPHKYNQND